MAFFGVNFILKKIWLCKKMTNMRYADNVYDISRKIWGTRVLVFLFFFVFWCLLFLTVYKQINKSVPLEFQRICKFPAVQACLPSATGLHSKRNSLCKRRSGGPSNQSYKIRLIIQWLQQFWTSLHALVDLLQSTMCFL